MGPEAKRRLKLRNLPNEELLRLYDSELVLRLHNARNLSDTRKILDRFKEQLGSYPPSAELAKGFLAPYASRQPRTLYRYTQMIKAFMKWYGEPIDDLKIKIPKSIPKYTEKESIDRVREAFANKKTHKKCIPRDLLLFDLDQQSGLRRAELSNLLGKDIHADFLEVRKGKGEKDRVIPLTPSMALRLHNFIKENTIKPDDRLFKLTPGSISNKIRQFADRAGISDLHTHSLRHKFATDLLEGGTNIRVVQDLMGHENLNTTQVYLSINDEARKEAIRRLDKNPGPGTGEYPSGRSQVPKSRSELQESTEIYSQSIKPGLTNRLGDLPGSGSDRNTAESGKLPDAKEKEDVVRGHQERHQQKMLPLVERWRQELRLSCSDLAIKDLVSPDTLRDRNTGLHSFSKSKPVGFRSVGLSWQARQGDIIDLCYPLELESDPETCILRDYIFAHLRSSPYSWVLDDVNRGMRLWKRLGGEELKQRAILLNRLGMQIIRFTGNKILIDDSISADRPGPTQWFADSIWAAAIDNLYSNLPYYPVEVVGEGDNGSPLQLFKARYGARCIGYAMTKGGAEQYQEWHRQILNGIQDEELSKIKHLINEREKVNQELDEVLARFLVDFQIPGKCTGCFIHSKIKNP